MDNQYKRTLAGSVGAGMGAIFNGNGRSYYILEHKTATEYHNVGESQKIIVDQVELGRDSSCQVRFSSSSVMFLSMLSAAFSASFSCLQTNSRDAFSAFFSS